MGKGQVEDKILLGRPGNNLKSGIVGLANVGKSTLFQAITKSSLGNPANFPFATIEPEDSRVIVPDDRFDWLCEHYKPKSKVPAHMDIFDIAGLTRGASTGAGLGNAFLSHIRAVDAIFQVTRCFNDAEIIHIEGDVNPIRDLEIIANELRIKDTEFAEKALENLAKQTRGKAQSLEVKKLLEEQNTIRKILFVLTKMNMDVRKAKWTPKEVEVINSLLLLTAKPVVYLLNVSEQDYVKKGVNNGAYIMAWIKSPQVYKTKVRDDAKEKATKKGTWTEADEAKYQAEVSKDKAEAAELKAEADKAGVQVDEPVSDPIILISISFEERLTRFESDAEVAAECKKIGAKSNLPKLITTMRTALQLNSFFTTGTDEVRQWTIRKGTKAPAAAGVIHTDFQKTFIQAIVYNYKTLKEEGDEATVRAKGKIMTKGKDYVVDDGDILLIKAGAAKG